MICLLTCLRSRTQISTVKPMRRMPASTRMGPRMTRGPSQLTSAESSLQAAPAPAPAASSTTAVRERQQIMCLSDRRFRSAFRARLLAAVITSYLYHRTCPSSAEERPPAVWAPEPQDQSTKIFLYLSNIYFFIYFFIYLSTSPCFCVCATSS